MKSHKIIGIGAGPANLSLAALSTKIANANAIFIEKREEFIWHSGMLLPGATLQVPFLHDLVTLADPTSQFSFLNFLVSHNRLYQFIAANFTPMIRAEFNQYFQWVFNQLDNIKKGEEVLSVSFNGDKLSVTTTKSKYNTQNLVLGIGQVPFIPDIFKKHLSKDVFHNSYFMDNQKNSHKKKRIAVIGGGQSGAEIIHNLISDNNTLPSDLFWISRRPNFSPLDDTPFTNEIFTPQFIKYFYGLEDCKKQHLIKEHKLANQGISEWTAKEIYQKLYQLKFIDHRDEKFNLLPSHELISINKIKKEYYLTIQDLTTGNSNTIVVDKIILCTGYHYQIPEFLSKLQTMLKYDNNNSLKVGADYQLIWEGMDTCSIYIQNGAQHSHGISDSTLCTSAYRSASILNNIMGEDIYPNIGDSSLIQWGWESGIKN